jgi:hypothetical protein
MLTFHCSSCGHVRQVPDEYAGRSAKCPKCGTSNRIITDVPSNAIPNLALSTPNEIAAQSIEALTHVPPPTKAAPKLERKGIDLKGWLAILSNVLLLAMLTAVVAGVVHLSTTKAQLAEVSARLETANAKLSNVDSLLLSIAESKLRAL